MLTNVTFKAQIWKFSMRMSMHLVDGMTVMSSSGLHCSSIGSIQILEEEIDLFQV
jgi:DDE superfamily endonuclease